MKNRVKAVLLLALLCLCGIWTGCSEADSMNVTQNNNGAEMNLTAGNKEQVTIVCTTFPLYDWTMNILGEAEAEVILLLNNGTDMHSFQPSAQELIQIADCDILIHVGGESDSWLEDALEAQPNEERIVVNLMDSLGDAVKEETFTEGMQTEHTHADGSVHEGEHENEGTQEGAVSVSGELNPVGLDEHIWLSLRYAQSCCTIIEDALCQVLPQNEGQIRQNGFGYRNALQALDVEYSVLAKKMVDDILLVADRFPFLYLAEDYGITYYAAFPGCSTESEADFETVIALTEKINEYEIDTIFITESGTDTLAKTLMNNATYQGQNIQTLHSLQVVYQSDIANGCSYLGYMEENLSVLQEAFGAN